MALVTDFFLTFTIYHDNNYCFFAMPIFSKMQIWPLKGLEQIGGQAPFFWEPDM